MAQSRTTRRKCKKPRTQYWRRTIAQWKDSGLTQTEFCRQRKISLPALRWWKWKLAQDESQKWQPAFLPIRIVDAEGREDSLSTSMPAHATSDTVFEIISHQGYLIRIPMNFEQEALVRLLKTLEVASC